MSKTISKSVMKSMLLVLILAATSTMATAAMTVSTSDSSGDSGTTVQIPVDLANAPTLGSLGFTLTYDSDVLTNTGYTTGDIFAAGSMKAVNNGTAGTIIASVINTEGINTAGNGSILVFTFTVSGSTGETSDLALSSVSASDTSAVPVTTYTSSGTFTVGGAAPTLTTFTVTPTTVEQGGTVDIDIAFSTEVSWAINVNNSTATVETWSGTSTNPTEKHWVTTTGTPTGDYTVDVFMNDVLVDSKTVTVTEAGAANQPPTAVIASPTASGTYREGTEVSFLSTGSTDPDGTIVSYNWTFGDGSAGTGVSTTHTYTTNGSMTVTLTVTDDDGATNSTTVTVTVSPAIVQINSWTLPSTGTRGTSISATVTIENTGTETIWFVVSISGTQDTTGYPIVSTGTVRLDAGESVDAPVMITVPGSADTGSYTLTPVVYKLDDYPAGDPQAIGSGKSVTIS